MPQSSRQSYYLEWFERPATLAMTLMLWGVIFFLINLESVRSTKANEVRNGPTADEFYATLPEVSCDSIRIVRTGTSGEMLLQSPQRTHCEKFIQALKNGGPGIWPKPARKLSFEQMFAAANKTAVKMCEELTGHNSSGSTADNGTGCLLNFPEADQPIWAFAYRHMVDQADEDRFGFGSICTKLPLQKREALASHTLPAPLIESLRDGAQWNEVEAQLMAEGFHKSLNGHDTVTMFLWTVTLEGEGTLFMPQWFSVYNGEKTPKDRRFWGCQEDQACSDGFEAYKRLEPQQGLCFAFDGMGP